MRALHRSGAIAALAALWALGSFSPARSQGTIADYLMSPSAGPVSASDILNLSGTVSNLQTPRDLSVVLGSLDNRKTQAGLGISFAPGRSSFGGLGVNAADYADPSGMLARVWGGTAFSFAQNRKSIGGADHAQRAFAVSVNYYLSRKDDPIVAAWDALEGETSGPCKAKLAELGASEEKVESFILGRIKGETLKLGRPPTLAEREVIEAKARADFDAELKQKLTAVRTCAHEAAAATAKKWNSNRVQVALGEASIETPGATPQRFTLGRYARLSLALRSGDDGLFNVTLRRAADELDTATIASTPSYRTSNRAALRYTHKPASRDDLFAIAEVSNARSSGDTLSNESFRHALGVDHKIADGLWIELRVGRARNAESDRFETKALFSLKFAPESTLEAQAKKAK